MPRNIQKEGEAKDHEDEYRKRMYMYVGEEVEKKVEAEDSMGEGRWWMVEGSTW
jgi:hypothetical protein